MLNKEVGSDGCYYMDTDATLCDLAEELALEVLDRNAEVNMMIKLTVRKVGNAYAEVSMHNDELQIGDGLYDEQELRACIDDLEDVRLDMISILQEIRK